MMDEATLRRLREQQVALHQYHEALDIGDEYLQEIEVAIGIIDAVLENPDDAILTESDWVDRIETAPVDTDAVIWPSHVDELAIARAVNNAESRGEEVDG